MNLLKWVFFCLIPTRVLFAFCADWSFEADPLPYGRWIYENYPTLPGASIQTCGPDFFLSNVFDPITPYSDGEFTKISLEQIDFCNRLTACPAWSGLSIDEYTSFHEETNLDRNLCAIASLMGIIIHAGIKQADLEAQLNKFNIRKLLLDGPTPSDHLSIEAQTLIYNSLKDIQRVLDIHLHNYGYDEGNFVHPRIAAQKKASYRNYFAFTGLRYASGMSAVRGSAHEARKRMHLYAGHFPKLLGMVLPIHKSIKPSGEVDWKTTGLFLKNRSAALTALTFANQHADSELLPAVSIHPFDVRWKEKLLTAHRRGIRLVKWMPPQSIPPDSPLLDEFYDTMQQLKMVLIAHSGIEHAIPVEGCSQEWVDWGNPLRFRRALELGVNVILAHCGHKDLLQDIDHSDQIVPGYELFLRLAREAHKKNLTGEWKGFLFGDLAAVTTHYGPDFIKKLLEVANEEGVRIIYGSDFPFTNLIQPKRDAYEICAMAGILDASYVAPLKEIRNWNPLLANYVFTRNLEMERANGEKIRFQESTFTGEFQDIELILVDRLRWDQFKKTNSTFHDFSANKC